MNEELLNHKKERNVIERSFQEKIIIDKSDKDLSLSGIEFIENLEIEYSRFLEELAKADEEYETYTKEVELSGRIISYAPEKVTSRSPMTIIDAPWGSGKSYFIESVAKNIALGKIKPNILENVIIIDAWKQTDSHHVEDEIISELFEKMSIASNHPERKEIMMNIAAYLFDVDTRPWINRFGDEMEHKHVSSDVYHQSVSQLTVKPTLVFLDNVERLGELAWDVIRAVKKISVISNFLFVLPMNENKLVSDVTDQGEFKLEKFVNLNPFVFEQNYSSILNTFGFDDEVIERLVEILEIELEGQKLSVRELEHRLSKHEINKETEFSSIIRKFVKEIWGNNDVAANIIKEDIDGIVQTYEKHKEKTEDALEKFMSFINNSKLLVSSKSTHDFFDHWLEFESSSIDDEETGKKVKQFKAVSFTLPHPLDIFEYSNYLHNLEASLDEQIQEWRKTLTSLNEKYDTNDRQIPNLRDIRDRNEKLLETYQKELSDLENADVKNAKEINIMKSSIEDQQKHLEKAAKMLQETEDKVRTLNAERSQINFLSDLEEFYEEFESLIAHNQEVEDTLKHDYETKEIYTTIQHIVKNYSKKEKDRIFHDDNNWELLKEAVIHEILGIEKK